MIVLFTDFGLSGPYTGQVKAVLAQAAPAVPVIDLFADAPAFDPQLSAYLLAAYAEAFPAETVFVGVVDPGVGTDRRPLVVHADGRWFVGPDDGLFELILRRAGQAAAWRIDWRPSTLSATFHGRDLFAPVAALLALGHRPPGLPDQFTPLDPARLRRTDWPDDLPRIVYIDVYGNAITGLRASSLPSDALLQVGGETIARARTFADVTRGAAFWYANSNGLAEVAVNCGRADLLLGLAVGDVVEVVAHG